MRDFDKQMEMVLYHSDEGDVSVDAYIKDESIWITQKAMAELFGVKVPDISKHLSNIYDEGELVKEATISKMEIVQREGNRDVKRTPVFYNLDAIISVGYRVNSIKATKFRIWATTVLKEYMTKGFVLDDDRLKQGKTAFGTDFHELMDIHIKYNRVSKSVVNKLEKLLDEKIYPLGAEYGFLGDLIIEVFYEKVQWYF